MATQPDDEFTLLPLNPQTDAHEILRIHYQVYLSDPMHSSLSSTLQTSEQYTTPRLPSTITRLSNPESISAKLVLTSSPSTIVSYILFNPPSLDSRSEEEKNKEMREEIEKRHEGSQIERVYGLMLEDQRLNESLLGKGYEGRWWELASLVTDENYQRKGLGSRLVEWGLERVEEDVKRRNGELGEGEERIEGCYLVASPQGARTYEKAGFVKVGERELELDGGKGKGKYMHAWFVRKFE